jgi:hypothetical protein
MGEQRRRERGREVVVLGVEVMEEVVVVAVAVAVGYVR